MNRVGIIGLGRVGTVMAYLLAEKGYHVKAVRSGSGFQPETTIKGKKFSQRKLEQLVQEVDVLFISTPDRIITEIVQKLARLELTAVKAVFHLSGNQPVAILKPLQEKGLFTASLHPLQSFAQFEQSLINLPGSTFTFEGDRELLPWVSTLIGDLGCKLLIAPGDLNKNLYHGGASIVSNFLVTLTKMGVECLKEAGLPPVEAQQALIPLMQGTLNNLGSLPPEKALTGPIVRGDLGTVGNHLQELKRLPHLLTAYQALGELTALLALEAGSLAAADYYKITEIIKEGGMENGKNDSDHFERKKEQS